MSLQLEEKLGITGMTRYLGEVDNRDLLRAWAYRWHNWNKAFADKKVIFVPAIPINVVFLTRMIDSGRL